MLKYTKRYANYRKASSPTKSCRVCRFMNSDGTCEKVQGIVKPDYVSDLFKPKLGKSDK